MPPTQAVEEKLDWQALDEGRSPNTVCAYKQEPDVFVALAAAAGVAGLGSVDWALLRVLQSDLACGPVAPLRCQP